MSSVSRRQRLTITVRDSQARPAPTLGEPQLHSRSAQVLFPRVTAINSPSFSTAAHPQVRMETVPLLESSGRFSSDSRHRRNCA